MLGDLLSNRWIQAGLVFFTLFVGGSLLYSWHVKQTTNAKLARLKPLPQQHETPDDTSTIDTRRVNFEPVATAPAQMDTPSEVLPGDATPMDLSDAFLPDDFVSEVEPAEEVPVSPYGFGPYPEVPIGYPLSESIPWHWSDDQLAALEKTMEMSLHKRGISFTEFLKENELMARVGIKLFNEGRSFDGIMTSDKTGRFYPNETDVLYVKWRVSRLFAKSLLVSASTGHPTPPHVCE